MLLQKPHNLPIQHRVSGQDDAAEVQCYTRLGWLLKSIALLILMLPVAAIANSYQSQTVIRDAARDFLQQQLENSGQNDTEITISRLDSRLKLSPCSGDLEAFLPTERQLIGKLTVGVKCTEPKPWSVYVPARIDVYQNVLAASRPLLRGQTVTAHDVLMVRKKMQPRSRNFFHKLDDIENMIIKRNIAAGKVFTPQLVQPPRLVHRGEEVILFAKTGELTVRMVGTALNDGSRGDLIQVRNSSSNRIIEGIVTTQGVVRVKM